MENEIIECNKLIAVFLGYKYHPHPERDSGWRKEKGHRKFHGMDYYLCRAHRDLKFNSSWDWLMLAVEKIERLDNVSCMDCRVKIERKYCAVYYDMGIERYEFSKTGSCKLQAAWLSVVDFIKWYNEQTNTNG